MSQFFIFFALLATSSLSLAQISVPGPAPKTMAAPAANYVSFNDCINTIRTYSPRYNTLVSLNALGSSFSFTKGNDTLVATQDGYFTLSGNKCSAERKTAKEVLVDIYNNTMKDKTTSNNQKQPIANACRPLLASLQSDPNMITGSSSQ